MFILTFDYTNYIIQILYKLYQFYKFLQIFNYTKKPTLFTLKILKYLFRGRLEDVDYKEQGRGEGDEEEGPAYVN